MNAQSPTTALMPTYARAPVAFVRGAGCLVWDESGKQYLDFLAGIAVNNLGHCHPAVVAAIREQAGRLIHTSNLYRIAPQERLAERLTATSFADLVFFCNSGAEANEAAIKLARRYMKEQGHPERFAVITALNSFHGRTLATLTATGQEKVKVGFEPLPAGFSHIPYNDLAAAEAAIGPETAAIMVEPVQGESGVRIPDDDYLPGLRELTQRHGILLILDEVQTGMGRTGKLWGYEWSGIVPDIITSAKALAGGLPMGACLATARVGAVFTPGTHASTFGGNHLVAAAALASLEQLTGEVLARVIPTGEYFLALLRELATRQRVITQVRGRGLMVAIELAAPAQQAVDHCLERGLLVSCAMGNVIRIAPPLIVTTTEIAQAVAIIDGVLGELF